MPVCESCTAWTQHTAWRFFFFLEALYYEIDPTTDRSALRRLLLGAFVKASRSSPSVSPVAVQRYFRSRSLQTRSTYPRSTRLAILPSNPAATHVIWGKETKCLYHLQLVFPAEPWNIKAVLSSIDHYEPQDETVLAKAGIAFSICAIPGTR